MDRSRSPNSLFVALFTLFLTASVVVAIAPGTLFELDGDTITGNQMTPHDDWNLLNGAGVAEGCVTDTVGMPGDSVTRTFCSGTGQSIFTQGGSKDPHPIGDWKWKQATTVPDKNTITNGYAARYQDAGTGNTIFVFGAERFATNGDSNIGVWLFQENVTNLEDGTFGPGEHKIGDLFAVSAFTQGGSNPGITVFGWQPACAKGVKDPVAESLNGSPNNTDGMGDSCAEANLSLLFASMPGTTCETGDAACAATNDTDSVEVSWDYAAKFGGQPNTVPPAGFFEGGMDVTELLSGSDLCFSSFLIETRSSQEPSAVLKDFIAGDLGGCTMPLVKLINGVEPTGCSRIDTTNPMLGENLMGTCLDGDGNDVTGLFTLTLTGPAPIPVGGLSVLVPPGFEAPALIDVPLTICETVPAGWKLIETDDVVLVLTPPPVDPMFDTTPTIYEGSGGTQDRCFDFTIPPGTVTFEIQVNNVKPELTLSKTAAIVINYSYLITNTGNVAITGPFSVSDGSLTVNCTQPGDSELSPGEMMSCAASVTPGTASGNTTNTATASGTSPAVTSDPDSVNVMWNITLDPTP